MARQSFQYLENYRLPDEALSFAQAIKNENAWLSTDEMANLLNVTINQLRDARTSFFKDDTLFRKITTHRSSPLSWHAKRIIDYIVKSQKQLNSSNVTETEPNVSSWQENSTSPITAPLSQKPKTKLFGFSNQAHSDSPADSKHGITTIELPCRKPLSSHAELIITLLAASRYATGQMRSWAQVVLLSEPKERREMLDRYPKIRETYGPGTTFYNLENFLVQ